MEVSQCNDSDFFNIIIIDEDMYYYSFNILKKDSLEYIASKIKKLVKNNIFSIIRINGPVDNMGRNFIEKRPLFDKDFWIEKANVK